MDSKRMEDMNVSSNRKLPKKLVRFIDTLGIADHWFGTASWKPADEEEEPPF